MTADSAEERVLHHVLGALLVADEQFGHPDQSQPVCPVKVRDQIFVLEGGPPG